MHISPISSSTNFGMALRVKKDETKDGLIAFIEEGAIKDVSRQVSRLPKITGQLSELIPYTDKARVDVEVTIKDGQIQGAIINREGELMETVARDLDRKQLLDKNFVKFSKELKGKLNGIAAQAYADNKQEISGDLLDLKTTDVVGKLVKASNERAVTPPDSPDA